MFSYPQLFQKCLFTVDFLNLDPAAVPCYTFFFHIIYLLKKLYNLYCRISLSLDLTDCIFFVSLSMFCVFKLVIRSESWRLD